MREGINKVLNNENEGERATLLVPVTEYVIPLAFAMQVRLGGDFFIKS